MERTDLERVEELLKNLRTDREAPKKLFQLFGNQMYKEARLYISDKDEAKNLCKQAFKHSYAALSKAKAEDVETVLKQAVLDECIKNTELEKSSTGYTDEDEVPASHASVSKDTNKVISTLRGILNHLTVSQRLVAVLKYRDGLDFKAIAKKLNTTEYNVKGILQDAKNSLKASNADISLVAALVNKMYPFYKEDDNAVSAVKTPANLTSEEEQFNYSVNELKEFFNTRTISMKAVSDHGIDDTDGNQFEADQNQAQMNAAANEGEGIDDTASSAKMIMAAAMSAESDKKKHDEKYNPVTYWVKRVAILLALLILGFAIAVGVSALRSKKSTPVNTPEPTETADIEETEEPTPTPEIEETPEPDDGIIGSAHIIVTDLTIRKGPGAGYEQNGITEYDATYDVYEVTEADGYTWYKVAEDQWVADYLGQYVTYTPKE